MNAKELNTKKTTLATLLAQKAITSDATILEMLNAKIREIESEIAAATKHESLPAQIERLVQNAMAANDRSALAAVFEDTDVRTAVGIVTNTVNSLWFRLFSLNAWYEGLGAQMGQSFSGNSALYGNAGSYVGQDPETAMIECQRQTEDVIAEVARWIACYHALVARAEGEGIELEFGQNPRAGNRDSLPTCDRAHSVYVANRERKQFQREAERKIVRQAQPSVFAAVAQPTA